MDPTTGNVYTPEELEMLVLGKGFTEDDLIPVTGAEVAKLFKERQAQAAKFAAKRQREKEKASRRKKNKEARRQRKRNR